MRNHLIFLLTGGAVETAEPAYSVQVGVVASSGSAATLQRTRDTVPTAATTTLSSSYVVTDIASNQIVATERRAISASCDVPRQQFAALRAQRDAEDRAARELAELMHHAIVQELGLRRRG